MISRTSLHRLAFLIGPTALAAVTLVTPAQAETNPRCANTTQQYKSQNFVALTQLKPGDLIFWATGDDRNTTTHVALFLGGDQILEAAPPRDGTSVHIKFFHGKSNWTAHAVRYIA